MSFLINAYVINFFETADFLPKGTDDASNDAFNSLPNAFWKPKNPILKLLTFSCTNIAPKTPISLSNEHHQIQEIHLTETPCSCLVRPFTLMRQISSSSPYTCTI